MKREFSWQYTEEEKVSILEFARLITPPNWNIFIDYGEIKNERRTVNVCLDFPDNCETGWKDCDPSIIGYAGLAQGIVMVDGDHGAQITLQAPWKPWKALIVHELAHIAVFRWVFYSTKVHMERLEVVDAGAPEYKRGGSIIGLLPPPHGKIFKRALAVMRKRAQKVKRRGV